MLKPDLLRSVALMLLGGTAIAAGGCGRDPMTEADANAVLAPIKAAVANQTGILGASNAKEVFTGAAMSGLFTSSRFLAPFRWTPSVAALPDDEYRKCFDDVGDAPWRATANLDCVTRGTTTGTQRWLALRTNGPHLEITDYDDVCSRSGGTCFSGNEALTSPSGSGSLRGREIVVTQLGSESRVVRSGSYVEYEPSSGKATARVHFLAYVIFDDAGRSYTLSAAPGVESGDVTVTAFNGAFLCTYRDRGEHGSCARAGRGPAFDW